MDNCISYELHQSIYEGSAFVNAFTSQQYTANYNGFVGIACAPLEETNA